MERECLADRSLAGARMRGDYGSGGVFIMNVNSNLNSAAAARVYIRARQERRGHKHLLKKQFTRLKISRD